VLIRFEALTYQHFRKVFYLLSTKLSTPETQSQSGLERLINIFGVPNNNPSINQKKVFIGDVDKSCVELNTESLSEEKL